MENSWVNFRALLLMTSAKMAALAGHRITSEDQSIQIDLQDSRKEPSPKIKTSFSVQREIKGKHLRYLLDRGREINIQRSTSRSLQFSEKNRKTGRSNQEEGVEVRMRKSCLAMAGRRNSNQGPITKKLTKKQLNRRDHLVSLLKPISSLITKHLTNLRSKRKQGSNHKTRGQTVL